MYNFLINPKAGKKNTQEIITQINNVCQSQKINYKIIILKTKKNLLKYLNALNTKDVAVIVGGDGTINFTINNLNPNIPFAVLPLGTGNDFFRYFNVNDKSYKNLIQKIIDAPIKKIDVATINGIKFVNSFSVGFDAKVCIDVNKLKATKLIPNKFVYPFATIKNLLTSNILELDINIDNKKINLKKELICTVMNGKYYGSGFTPTPNAQINDGFLDICLIEPISLNKLLPLVPKYLKGTHLNEPIVHTYRGKEITIKSKKSFIVEYDGETKKLDFANIKIKEGYLKIKMPNLKETK